MDKVEAARLLGVPEAEVTTIRDDPMLGPVAILADGREFVVTDSGPLALNPKEGDIDG